MRREQPISSIHVIDRATLTRFDSDQAIFRTGDRFYLTENGTVVLEAVSMDDSSVLIDRVSAGGLGLGLAFPPHLERLQVRQRWLERSSQSGGKIPGLRYRGDRRSTRVLEIANQRLMRNSFPPRKAAPAGVAR